MRLFCLRFDIDTYRCMRDGVPNLIELGRRTDARFTFFANMGRSVSRREIFRAMLGSGGKNDEATPVCAKLSNTNKLGYGGYLVTALLNPKLSRYVNGNLAKAKDLGHEVGLHGGSNHGTWHRLAATWDTATLRREVEHGLAELGRHGVNQVTSFSSPGWQGSDALNGVLDELGFELVGGTHGADLNSVSQPGARLRSVPTNILGEPGGVGYLEHLRALGMDDAAALERFRDDLGRASKFAVAYDHPYFAGTRELDLLEKMINEARQLGFETGTMSDIANRFAGEAAA